MSNNSPQTPVFFDSTRLRWHGFLTFAGSVLATFVFLGGILGYSVTSTPDIAPIVGAPETTADAVTPPLAERAVPVTRETRDPSAALLTANPVSDPAPIPAPPVEAAIAPSGEQPVPGENYSSFTVIGGGARPDTIVNLGAVRETRPAFFLPPGMSRATPG